MTKNKLIEKLKALIDDKTIGKLQRLARKRFLDDLLHGEDRGIFFDFKKANRVVKFIEMMRHYKGELAGKPFKLEEWQKYDIVYPLFGFVKKHNDRWVRRYKTAYVEVARKNGKSMLASAIANYLAFGDNEQGAEVYAVATKRDQAKIVWNASEIMKNNCSLKKYVKTAYSKMTFSMLNSVYEPLGADSKTLDGLNVHGAVIDEYHAHPNSELYDVIRSATGARLQPLIFIITTAGFNRESACYQERKYAINLLEGVIENDAYFSFVATLDEGDDPFDERNWAKANPNLHKSVKIEDFRDMAKEAKDKPIALNNFLTKKLNIWVDSQKRWISTDKWNKCYKYNIDESKLLKKTCFGGLDLSTTTDISALVWLFKIEKDGNYWWDILPRFWIPEENMRERVRRDKVPYDVWVRQGFIQTTEGDVIDYDFIQKQIEQDVENFDVKELAFDRWNSTSIINNLMNDGIDKLVPFGQGFGSMSAPTKELETLVLKRKINHGNNPVLRWMMSNIALKTDPAGNMKPDKARSSEKIDGIVALIMALGRAMVSKDDKKSIYETRSLRTL